MPAEFANPRKIQLDTFYRAGQDVRAAVDGALGAAQTPDAVAQEKR